MVESGGNQVAAPVEALHVVNDRNRCTEEVFQPVPLAHVLSPHQMRVTVGNQPRTGNVLRTAVGLPELVVDVPRLCVVGRLPPVSGAKRFLFLTFAPSCFLVSCGGFLHIPHVRKGVNQVTMGNNVRVGIEIFNPAPQATIGLVYQVPDFGADFHEFL